MQNNSGSINRERAQQIYASVLEKAAVINEVPDKNSKKPYVAEVEEMLSGITDKSIVPPDASLAAKALSLRGIARMQLAAAETNQAEKSAWLRTGTIMLAQATQALYEDLPGNAVAFIPDNLGALANAMKIASTEEKEEMARVYAGCLQMLLYSAYTAHTIRNQGIASLFHAEMLLIAAERVTVLEDKEKVLQKSLELTLEATHIFTSVFDQEALSRALEIRDRIVGIIEAAGPSVMTEKEGLINHAEAAEPIEVADQAYQFEDHLENWYISIQSVQYGPYNLENLRQYIKEGRVMAGHLLWHPRLDAWVPFEAASRLMIDIDLWANDKHE